MDNIFKALSSQIRRDIITYLRSGEKSATEISEQFELTKPTISHHLNILKKANLVDVRRDGNHLYYNLKTSVLEDIYSYFLDFRRKDEK